jgi:hypothetical protein
MKASIFYHVGAKGVASCIEQVSVENVWENVKSLILKS